MWILILFASLLLSILSIAIRFIGDKIMGRDYAVTYKVIKDSYSDEIGFIWHFLPVVNVFIILIVIIYIIFHYLKKIKNISLVKKADVFIDNLLNKLDGNSKN